MADRKSGNYKPVRKGYSPTSSSNTRKPPSGSALSGKHQQRRSDTGRYKK